MIRFASSSGRLSRGFRAILLLFLLSPTSGLGQTLPGRPRRIAEEQQRTPGSEPMEGPFRHVWKARVQRVRAARARLERPGMSLSAGDLGLAGAAVTGTLSFPVIAGAFSDVPGPYSPEEYSRRLFGDGSGTVSVTELYEEMSRGVFSVAGTVTPWITLSQNRAYYEPSPETDEEVGRNFEFITEALDGADAFVDFSQFDNDGPDNIPNSGDDDGFVDVVAFIYPTVALSCGGTGIWPHRWNYSSLNSSSTGILSAYQTDDPSALGGTILIDDYIIQSGLSCDGTSIMGSGTMSHELGHALDLPDLYDVDPYDGTDSEGIGEWGLMASGNHHEQTSPAHMSAWSKDFLGWLDVQALTSTESGLFLSPIQASGTVFRVDLPSSNEHFLLSNRQPLGSDQYLHGSGLLIWHIDRDLAGGISEVGNGVNTDAFHKGVDLEEADGQDDLDWSVNRGDAGDPFPGSSNAREFHALTYPSSRSYAGGACGVGIRNIHEATGNITFDLSVGEMWALWGDADGDGSVSTEDISQIFWYDLGYRDEEEQLFLANGDVDGDGDVDLMDGFLIDSYFSFVTLPENRIGEGGWTDCAPQGAPVLSPSGPSRPDFRVRGGKRLPDGRGAGGGG